MARYIVISNIKSLSFLDGYSCESEDKDHFLRHLGHRFGKRCNMYQLNNAHAVNDILIKTVKTEKTPENNGSERKQHFAKPNVVNEYWGTYGYILEINHGTMNLPIIEKRVFANDNDAREWVNNI